MDRSSQISHVRNTFYNSIYLPGWIRESQCPPEYYDCEEGICVADKSECDLGVVPGGGTCTEIRWRTCGSYSSRCFNDFEKCNGVNDCLSGVDEMNCDNLEMNGKY